jgi:hypothetical protein
MLDRGKQEPAGTSSVLDLLSLYVPARFAIIAVGIGAAAFMLAPREPIASPSAGATESGAALEKRVALEPGPPTSGFWLILVKPGARWVLKNTDAESRRDRQQIVVETYDVRSVGTARVGRLRWTHTYRGGKSPLNQCGFGCPTRVAVTAAGLYFLGDDASDAQILDAIKRPPDRSEPPRPYRATKQNHGRYLRFEGEDLCMGWEALPGAGPCEDTCFGEVCISSTAGIVQISGTWAPDYAFFAQPGHEE